MDGESRADQRECQPVFGERSHRRSLPVNWLWQKLASSLSPQQVCWVCILISLTGGAYGIRTFARNDQVQIMRIEQLQERATNMKIMQCEALKRGQPARFFAERVSFWSDKYLQVAGVRPDLPTCEEL